MRTSLWSSLVLWASVCLVASVGAQTPVGALAIDERQGDRWGWAVDYETASAAQGQALRECGAGCSVVLTFGRCAAYAADQATGSTAVAGRNLTVRRQGHGNRHWTSAVPAPAARDA